MPQEYCVTFLLISTKMKCARTRSKSVQDDKISTKHTIVVFNRQSVVSKSILSVHDLEDDGRLEIQESILSTSRMFSQDDCLHSESTPYKSPLCVRARYNFLQGLLNTKEAQGMQGLVGNAGISAFAHSYGRGLSTVRSQLSNQG